MIILPNRRLHFRAASGPAFANVKALLHMDDAGLTDVKGHTVTLNGGAVRSAAQSKFGGFAALFDGVGDWLSMADSADFEIGASNAVIEGFIYPVSGGPAIQTVVTKRADSGAWASYGLFLDSLRPRMVASSSGSSYFLDFTAAGALPLNTWSYLALVRTGTAWAVYTGTGSSASAVVTATAAGTCFDNAGPFNLGGETNGGVDRSFSGYLDEWRVTIGESWSPTTVPVAAFPDA